MFARPDVVSAALLIASILVVSCGCPLASAPVAPPPAVSPEADDPPSTDRTLEALIRQTLDRNLAERRLSTETHGAWQILHGVLAYGEEFTVDSPGGETAALAHLLGGGAVDGFDPMRGDQIGSESRPGMRIEMDAGTKRGQGHRDQWLAIVSQCDLSRETEITTREGAFVIDDWLRQAEYDVPRNLELEFSWTLIALTRYRGTEYAWMGRDGVMYSVEDLVASEVDQDLASSVCGGTHRLIGLAMSLDRRRREGKPVQGVWRRAQQRIDQLIADAKRNQNADGSYSTAYMHRTGWTRDLGEALGTTGHVLEFLALAAPNETLSEPWIERTARRLCEMLDQCREIDLECGVLYHALHGLQEYETRLRHRGRDGTSAGHEKRRRLDLYSAGVGVSPDSGSRYSGNSKTKRAPGEESSTAWSRPR